jgi:hypothetical protein
VHSEQSETLERKRVDDGFEVVEERFQ